MGFIEQGHNNSGGEEDDDDDDGSDSPIEMTLVNRKGGASSKEAGGKRGKGKGKNRVRKGSDSSEPSEKELKLFDQDEEDRQPQNKRNTAAAGYTDYNPFDAEAAVGGIQKQDSHSGLIAQADVVGQAMVNEIDDALGGSSDDDNEFGSFV